MTAKKSSRLSMPLLSFLTPGWSDRAFLWTVILIILVVTTLPYFYGFLSAPAEKQFMGLVINVPDHVQYFSWMRDLSRDNLVSNKMTPEANEPLFFNLLWWVLGRLGSILGVGYEVMYQVLRLAAIGCFFPLAYRMCGWFLPDVLQRRTAFLAICFASGFGWVLVILKYLSGRELLFPLTVYVAEPNTFLSIMGYPHFVAALLYVFVFDLILRGQAKGQLRYSIYAGLFALFMGWQHAYDLVIVYGVLAAYVGLLILRDRKLPVYMIKGSIIIGLISWWPALYSVLLTSLDPIWKEILAQFANAGVYTPNPLLLIVLLGLGFIMAILTVIADRSYRLAQFDNNHLFILGWFLVSFVLVYLPVDYQIHMLNGWQIPIAILATRGLFKYVAPWVRRLPVVARKFPRSADPAWLNVRLAVVFLLAVLPTNAYLWTWRFYDLSRHDYPYYLNKTEIAAFRWLEANTQAGDVVFASLTIGQYIPAETGARAYLAHWAQTLDFFTKTDNVKRFYTPGTSAEERMRILSDKSVDFIFYGPAERMIGSGSPADLPLEMVFESGDVSIYRLKETP